MLRSIFFRRMLALLLLALLLWTLLTAIIYSFVARSVLTEIKVNELLPKAESVAQLASRNYFRNDSYFNELITSSLDLFDAWIFVVDGLSGKFLNTALPEAFTSSESEILEQIDSRMDKLLSGSYSSLWFTGQLKSAQTDEMLYIGVPVYLGLSNQNPVIGAVFFVQPLTELNAGLNSMNIALLASSLFVFALMIMPVYLATAKLIRPLRQTRNVAMAMADGQFSLRADVRQKGEIGELAMTMNHLAQSLSKTISDLVLEKNRLKQIIDGMKDGLIAVDSDGKSTQMNQMACALIGLIEPQILTDIHQINQPLAKAFDEAIKSGRPITLMLDIQNRVIRVQVSPLSDENELIVGGVALLHDSTEAVRLEQTRRDYVANISHELRSPLTAMRALVEPLNDGMVSQEADRQRYFNILLREIIRLSRLIDDMLELSRLQANALPIQLESFRLSNMLRDLSIKYTPQAEEKGLKLQFSDAIERCPLVYADPDRIEQVLIILLDNAIKFTPKGGLITVDSQWDDSSVFITIRDTGIGIDPSDINHVFDRFYKADKAHHQTGTGLGLSIAQEILQKMNQTITVESNPQQCAAFTFSLSRYQADKT